MTREQYLLRAKDCEERAGTTTDPAHKRYWLDAAEQWRALAVAASLPRYWEMKQSPEGMREQELRSRRSGLRGRPRTSWAARAALTRNGGSLRQKRTWSADKRRNAPTLITRALSRGACRTCVRPRAWCELPGVRTGVGRDLSSRPPGSSPDRLSLPSSGCAPPSPRHFGFNKRTPMFARCTGVEGASPRGCSTSVSKLGAHEEGDMRAPPSPRAVATPVGPVTRQAACR